MDLGRVDGQSALQLDSRSYTREPLKASLRRSLPNCNETRRRRRAASPTGRWEPASQNSFDGFDAKSSSERLGGARVGGQRGAMESVLQSLTVTMRRRVRREERCEYATNPILTGNVTPGGFFSDERTRKTRIDPRGVGSARLALAARPPHPRPSRVVVSA